MATQRTVRPLGRVWSGLQSHGEIVIIAKRSLTTEIQQPGDTLSQTYADAHINSAPVQPILEDTITSSTLPKRSPTIPPIFQAQTNPFITKAQCTLHEFPSFEPVRITSYPSTHLLLPLRRDLLHRAAIYEADAARAGTGSTKWRSEVHGSNKKIRPQKGTGKARLGDKKSPMLRGGGVTHGPKPRDFSTDLPKKIYDLAWRTALSYRYKKGELIVADGELELKGIGMNSVERFAHDVLNWNIMGKAGGKTLFVAKEWREGLFTALAQQQKGHEQAFALPADLVDIRDLLRGGKLVVEKSALDLLFAEHESDLGPLQKLQAWQ